MKVPKLALILFVLCMMAMPCFAKGQQKTTSNVLRNSLRISISQGLDLNKVIVVTGQYGNGLFLGRASKKFGHGFIQPISFSTTKVKVLGYYPGYRLATVEVSNGYVPSQIPVILNFIKLPTVPLTLQILNSKGEPAANCKVAIFQSLQEQPYFGYYDGAISDGKAAPVASGVTDGSGIWKTKVPKLSEDPLFPVNEWKSPFSLMCESDDGRGPIYSFIENQDSYKDPVVVKLKRP